MKSDAELAGYLGIATTTLSSWKSRGSIDYDLIYAKCVDINANWLFTGTGDMLIKTQRVPSEKIENDSNTRDKYIIQLEKENRRLNADNMRKQQIINGFLNGSLIIPEKSTDIDPEKTRRFLNKEGTRK